MKKKLDPSNIASELKTGSLFFQPTAHQSASAAPLPASHNTRTEHKKKTKVSVPQSPHKEGTAGRVSETRSETFPNDTKVHPSMTDRSFERTKIRHSFDVFQDQLFELRDLAYERQRGSLKKVSLGDLVQEALDMYLAAQRRAK